MTHDRKERIKGSINPTLKQTYIKSLEIFPSLAFVQFFRVQTVFTCVISGLSRNFIPAFSINYGLMLYLLLIINSFVFYFIIIITII